MNVINVNFKDVCFEGSGYTPEEIFAVYNAQPATFMIEKLNAWRVEGFKIVIETDRDVETELNVIHEWLQYYDVPFDEIVWKH